MNADRQTLAGILSVLRQWGWETGIAKLDTATDDAGRATVQWLRGASAAESDAAEGVPEWLQGLDELPELLGWARAGQALAAMRKRNFKPALKHLDKADQSGAGADKALRATLAHYRATVLFHQGEEGCDDAALAHLRDALELFGKDHFVTCHVLDTFGMVYAGKDSYPTAREFYERAIVAKQRTQDEPGLALSHGQLGRLELDWGDLEDAEKHFLKDLEICLRIGDEHGAALMYSSLGRAALAAKDPAKAGPLLDESIRRAGKGGWTITEGYARKDRALAHLAAKEMAEAERQVEEAEELFRAAEFNEGLAHTNRVRGKLLSARGQFDEAEKVLGAALVHFEKAAERVEVARTQWEMAHVLRVRGAHAFLVSSALLVALDSAERCRRHALVREIEAELHEVDEPAHIRHVYQRARGRGIREDTVSLLSGTRATGTVLFLDLQGSTDYMRDTDPQVVLVTLNQMMADLAGVLERHDVSVTVYLGDGFMALVRGQDHARRGVQAALDMAAALKEFNRPRQVLGLTLLKGRVGLSTGEFCLGNVGTYHKMDFTALGTTVNLAARLQTEAEPGQPCISQGTYEQVRDCFLFKDENGRLTLDLKGLGVRRVWDVIGPKPRTPPMP